MGIKQHTWESGNISGNYATYMGIKQYTYTEIKQYTCELRHELNMGIKQ